MLLLPLLLFAASLAASSLVAFPQQPLVAPQQQQPPPLPFDSSKLIDRNDFASWLDVQPHLSLARILHNIGGSSFNHDLPNGVVIAASSKKAPNYYYLWIRDSALTINSLVTHLNDVGLANRTIAHTVEHYINNNYNIQRTQNPSGDFGSGGLGEPKFNVNNTAFTDKWGRPQNDGPALRSVAIMNYLAVVDKHNNGSLLLLSDTSNPEFRVHSAADIYHEIVKPDLDYVVRHWHSPGFDLWEENKGKHFFTALVQLKALRKGAEFAKQFDDYVYAKHLKRVAVKLQHFIYFESAFVNDHLHRIFENPGFSHKYGLDMATVIASLVTHTASNDIDNNAGFDIPFDVDDSYILNSLYAFIKDQNERFAINHEKYKPGISLGRYPNDVYDGVGVSLGNPWFLSNAYAGWYFYKKIYKLASQKNDLVIFNETYPFYNEFVTSLSSVDPGYATKPFVIVPFASDAFGAIVKKLFAFGDSFLKIILQHITDDGELSEQFHRSTGFSQGAKNLTWSYSSVWGAIRERKLVEKYVI